MQRLGQCFAAFLLIEEPLIVGIAVRTKKVTLNEPTSP